MKTKKEQGIEILMSRQNAEMEVFHGLTIICYTKENGQPICAIYARGPKPYAHYRWNSIEERTEYIEKQKALELKNAEVQNKRKAEYAAITATIEAGTILYSSWGYEQTNIDFYKAIERRGSFIILQEIGKKRTYDERFDDRGECMPDASKIIGEPFRRKLNKYGGVNLESYKSCSIFDGKSKYWSSYA